jgi:RpiB/LacA/LacB family sugar-phosphate isomerase
MLYIGSDHRGFDLKEELKKRLKIEGIEFEDVGNTEYDPHDDYVDFAKLVGEKVSANKDHKGVLICGSGVGVDMVANKIKGVRSSLVYDKKRAAQSREHEDANVVSIPADVLVPEQAMEIITTFINTEFTGEERHLRRLKKMSELENQM